jgi:SAP domain-containing new25/Domain of unknown function (DUF6434)
MKKLNIEEFKSKYYYKQDLIKICQEYQIPYSGLMKYDLERNIIAYLEGKNPVVKSKKKTQNWTQDKLGLQEVVTDNFRCNPLTRKFFESIIGPKFTFFGALINHKKNNPDKVIYYQDLVDLWYQELINRKNGKSSTAKFYKANRYNKFMKQYYAQNKGKTHTDMIKAWENFKKSGI